MIGSICGIIELFRNSLNLWAKCFNHQKLAVAFQILGFITAFLFILNFILMQLYRFEHLGRVCAGDYLTEDAKWDTPGYLLYKGYFISVMVMVIYGMVGLMLLSVLLLALTLRYSKNKDSGRQSFLNDAMKSVLDNRS